MTALEVIQNDDDVLFEYGEFFKCDAFIDIHACSHEAEYDIYSPIDGRCNNLLNPSWGSHLSKHNRFLPTAYSDAFRKNYVIISTWTWRGGGYGFVGENVSVSKFDGKISGIDRKQYILKAHISANSLFRYIS